MIRNLFHRPNREEDLYAEAQALIDDGLDLDFVLALYPDDADWLAPLLDTGIVIGETFAAEEPSFYFEASLKNRFIDAGVEKAARSHEPVREPVAVVPSDPAAGFMRAQGMLAGTAVALLLGTMSVVTLGIVTAGDSVPGDWNYAFKLAGERIEYSLSSGDERVDIQINHTLVRIQELEKLKNRGDVSPEVIEDVRNQLEEINSLAKERPLDSVQNANVRAIGEASAAVLEEVKQRNPELAPQIDEALGVAASLGGGVTTIEEPTPTPTPTEEPTEEPAAEPTATAESTATAEPEASPQPTAEATNEAPDLEEPIPPAPEAPAE